VGVRGVRGASCALGRLNVVILPGWSGFSFSVGGIFGGVFRANQFGIWLSEKPALRSWW
jgi:hypothetical protein